jgi:type VI secretion system secreted protein VgrG
MKYTQANRLIAIDTPLGGDALLLRGFHGREAISRLFQFDLDLLSESRSVSFDDVVGKNVTLRISLADGSDRYWNGFVSRFSQGPFEQGLTQYHAVMVPWLWFLTRTADCRIFQNKKAPDIIQQIFKDLGFSEFKLQLYGDFVEREYCVQYRETDFNFVSRLMEEEGIFYFFEHEDGKHTLILANDPAAHKCCPNQPSARCALTPGSWQDEDVILEWRQEQEVRPGSYAVTDYNFETPSSSLAATVAGKNTYEIYDYPGEYRKRAEGDSLAHIRLQEQEMPRIVARGSSDCRAFTTGFRFDLTNHYRSDLNQSYVLTAISHVATQGGDYTSGPTAGDSQFSYSNSFECIPFSTPFRPPRITPAPVVQGCQTAVVVGPAGEEIFTDEHGRVKVQFHWDREGKRDENSSCWIRVSHPWAGKGWGSVSIPRIGQEVIVDFLEGDPDQPIIVGRVYNAGQMPPFGMPGGAVVSGIKSNSTKGGGGYNEISLNDTKGTELINVHGQYDMQTKVEHDERVTIGNNRTKSVAVNETTSIGSNRTESVGANENITIGASRAEQVAANEKITIGANRTEQVGANETIVIGGNRTETVGSLESISVGLARTRSVGAGEMVNIGAAQMVNVGAAQVISVGGLRALNVGAIQFTSIGASLIQQVGASARHTIGASLTEKVGANHGENIGAKRTTKIGGNRMTKIGGKDLLKVGSKMSVDAGDEIVLKTGASSITLKSGGDIIIKGTNIKVEGTAKIEENAANITSEAQAKNEVKGAMVNVEASGIGTIKGSLVKIN